MSQPAPVNQWTTVTRQQGMGTIDNNWVLSIGGKSRCSTDPVVECDYHQGLLDSVTITRA